MKTIIWKELRENFKWAVLALLGLLIAEIYALYKQHGGASDPYGNLTLCSSTFLLATALGCAAVGAVLGGLQILPELRRDQWAALLHRPISRRAIFLGKVGAGLLLYLLATIPPLIVSVLYVAWPGQFAAPFVPGMVLPAVSDLALGMAFYFLALLVSLHRGPWYGKRSLLGLSILPMLALHLAGPWMFLPPIIGSFVLVIAAAGAMNHNGPIKDYPRTARYSIVFLLFVGVEVIVVFVLYGLAFLPTSSRKTSPAVFFREVVLATDGTLLIRNETMDSTKLTDMHGAPVTDERYVGNNRGNVFSEFVPITWNFKYDRAFDAAWLTQQPRDMRKYAMLANSESVEGPEAWFYLPEGRCFVGYDRTSGRRIGIIDRDGFHAGTAAVQTAFGDLATSAYDNQPYLFWSEKELYALDFSERSATRLLPAVADTFYGAAEPRPQQSKIPFIAVGLEKEIHMIETNGTPICTIPYPHDPSAWPAISVATVPAGDRIFVKSEPVAESLHPDAEDAARPTFVDEFDARGMAVHSDSLAPLPGVKNPPGWVSKVTVATLPLAPTALGVGVLKLLAAREGPDSFPSWQIVAAEFGPPPLSVVAGVGALLAIGAWFWGRRAGLPAANVGRWAIFIFCFGLPGLIVFRLAAGWPARIPCPHCSRQRSVETDECPDCHQTWPAPERNGTEIFHRTADGLG